MATLKGSLFTYNKPELEDVLPQMVRRADWGALPPKACVELEETPVRYVILTHTDWEPPPRRTDYARAVRILQKKDMAVDRLDDILHNFLVAPDGTVFEGRGWETAARPTPLKLYWLKDRALVIGMVGNFTEIRPPETLTRAAHSLIDYGILRGFISNKITFYYVQPWLYSITPLLTLHG